MKDFVKKLSAVITLVAMIASLGVCGFAVEAGAAITINGYEWSDVVGGVATVTVTYTVSEDSVGALGATMLTYAKGSYDASFGADDDGIYDGEDTAYADTMQIVGIDQGAPKTLVEGVLTPVDAVEGVYPTGTYVAQFPVVVSGTATSAAGVQLGSGEKAIILIGGDNVIAPGALLLEAPYIPWEVNSITHNFGSLSVSAVVYAEEIEEVTQDVKKNAVAEALVEKLTDDETPYIVTANKGDVSLTVDNITLSAIDGITATAELDTAEGKTENDYIVTVEIPVGEHTDSYEEYKDEKGNPTAGGIVVADKNTFEVSVNATISIVAPVWEVAEEQAFAATPLELSEGDYAKTGADLNAAIKAALVEELLGDESALNLVLNVKKADEESTATVAITADDITVTSVTPGETMTYEATVEIPAGEYAVEGAEDKLVLDDDDIVIAVTGNVTKELGVAYGNVNGDKDADGNDIINMKDAIAAMQIYKGTIAEPTEQQIAAADVNGVGGVNMQDAILIMQFYKNAISRFPVEGPVED